MVNIRSGDGTVHTIDGCSLGLIILPHYGNHGCVVVGIQQSVVVIGVSVASRLARCVHGEHVIARSYACQCLREVYRVCAVALAHVPGLFLYLLCPCAYFGSFPSVGSVAQVGIGEERRNVHARLISACDGLVEHLLYSVHFLIYKRVGSQVCLCDVDISSQRPVVIGLCCAIQVVLQSISVGTEEVVVLIQIGGYLLALGHVGRIDITADDHGVTHVEHGRVGWQEFCYSAGGGECLRQSATLVYQPLFCHDFVEILILGILNAVGNILNLSIRSEADIFLASLYHYGVCGVIHGVVVLADVLVPGQVCVVIVDKVEAESASAHLFLAHGLALCAIHGEYIVQSDVSCRCCEISVITSGRVTLADGIAVFHQGVVAQPPCQESVFKQTMYATCHITVAKGDAACCGLSGYATHQATAVETILQAIDSTFHAHVLQQYVACPFSDLSDEACHMCLTCECAGLVQTEVLDIGWFSCSGLLFVLWLF